MTKISSLPPSDTMVKPSESTENKKPEDSPAASMSSDELSQVRELLFGSTLRDIDRQRDDIKQEMNTSKAETDQLINNRLNDVMRRVEALQRVIERDRAERKEQAAAEAKRIDAALVELASEQAMASAKESKRVDDAIDALNLQLTTDSQNHIESLKTSVSDERSRLAKRMLTLANSIREDLA